MQQACVHGRWVRFFSWLLHGYRRLMLPYGIDASINHKHYKKMTVLHLLGDLEGPDLLQQLGGMLVVGEVVAYGLEDPVQSLQCRMLPGRSYKSPKPFFGAAVASVPTFASAGLRSPGCSAPLE